MLEAGLGVMAACLPVQYGLLKSEKVQSMIRSIHSLTSLGSRGSGSGGSGNRSGGSGSNSRARSFYMAQSRGQSQSQNLNTTAGSDAGEAEAEPPLPTSGIRGSSDAGSQMETQGIVVSKTFGAEEHAAQHV